MSSHLPLSPLQPFSLADWPHKAPRVWVKRDDLIHPIVSGNKWRKLAHVEISRSKHVVSIGGGYSNHLHALGFKCIQQGVRFTALVRGDYSKNLTPMLKDLTNWGCELHWLSKKEYAVRDTSAFQSWIDSTFSKPLFIPEGGSTKLALKGIGDMMLEIDKQAINQLGFTPTTFIAPVASGATLAGIASGAKADSSVLGIAVLKGESYLQQQVARFLPDTATNWQITHDYTFGGYAKSTPSLKSFCEQVYQQTQLSIEPVYSGKAFFAVDALVKQHAFRATDNLIVVHTGGLQGAR